MKTRTRLFVGLMGIVLVFGTYAFARAGTGTGFWLGDVGGTPKFSIGNPAGAYMTWDGTELFIRATAAIVPTTTLTYPSGVANLVLQNSGNNYHSIYIDANANSTFLAIVNGIVGQQISIRNVNQTHTLTIYSAPGSCSGAGCFDIPGGSNAVLNPGGSITAEGNAAGHWYVLTVNPG